MLECNYLTILLKTNYEKPVDTAKDIIERGLTILFTPNTLAGLNKLKNSQDKISQELAELVQIPEVMIFYI